jgi:hypothetical protein
MKAVIFTVHRCLRAPNEPSEHRDAARRANSSWGHISRTMATSRGDEPSEGNAMAHQPRIADKSRIHTDKEKEGAVGRLGLQQKATPGLLSSVMSHCQCLMAATVGRRLCD